MGERGEAFVRILVAIIGGIIIGFWEVFVKLVFLIHWIYVLITGRRNEGLARLGNYFVSYVYKYMRYVYFTTNKRPFPFTDLGNVMEPVDISKKNSIKKK